MKKHFFSLSLCLCFALCISFVLSGCGVTPCAWVKLDMEGYVYVTSYVYPGHGHILLYEDQTTCEEDTHRTNYKIMIEFFPRCLSHDVDDWDVALVDVGDKYCEMHVAINKTAYPDYATRKMFMNGTELTPSAVQDESSLYFLTYNNFSPVRGNPNGQRNDVVNILEYKLPE